MRERERFTFFNLVLSALAQVAGFTSCFSIVCTHHYATLLCQWHPPFPVQSDRYAPPLVSSRSYSVAHALFFPSLQNPTLFSKHHHRPFSKHAHTIVLHLPWLVHPKYPLNPANSEVLCSHYCFFSSYQNCYLILPQTQCLAPIQHCGSYATLTNPFFYLKKTFSHKVSPHIL